MVSYGLEAVIVNKFDQGRKFWRNWSCINMTQPQNTSEETFDFFLLCEKAVFEFILLEYKYLSLHWRLQWQQTNLGLEFHSEENREASVPSALLLSLSASLVILPFTFLWLFLWNFTISPFWVLIIVQCALCLSVFTCFF